MARLSGGYDFNQKSKTGNLLIDSFKNFWYAVKRFLGLYIIGQGDTWGSRLAIALGNFLVFLNALQCYFVAGGSFALLLIALHVVPTTALLIGFLGPVAWTSLFINIFIGMENIVQSVYNLLHSRRILTTVIKVDAEGNKEFLYEMGNGRRVLLALGFVFSLAAGGMVGGVTWGFFTVLLPFFPATLVTVLTPIAVVLVVSSVFGIAMMLFKGMHDYIRQDWFTFAGIWHRIKNYLRWDFDITTYKQLVEKSKSDELNDEEKAQLSDYADSLKGSIYERSIDKSIDLEEAQKKLNLQYVTSLLLSGIVVTIVIFGLIMSVFVSSMPGLAEFIANEFCHLVAPTLAIKITSWIIASAAWVGMLPFFMSRAITLASDICSGLFNFFDGLIDSFKSASLKEKSTLKKNEVSMNHRSSKTDAESSFLIEEIVYSLSRMVNAITNGLVGSEKIIADIAHGIFNVLYHGVYGSIALLGAVMASVTASTRDYSKEIIIEDDRDIEDASSELYSQNTSSCYSSEFSDVSINHSEKAPLLPDPEKNQTTNSLMQRLVSFFDTAKGYKTASDMSDNDINPKPSC